MLLAVAEHKDIQNELIPRIATGFCSGMGRTGGMCGAVSGGIMAIGISLGRNTPDDSIDNCYLAVQTLVERFNAQFHSTSCLELTGVHLGTAEGQAAFVEKGVDQRMHKLCGRDSQDGGGNYRLKKKDSLLGFPSKKSRDRRKNRSVRLKGKPDDPNLISQAIN